jgi:hypothetical protein
MPKATPYIVFLSILLCSYTAFAQQPAYTYYSIREGLPSNDIYNCVEDKRGFLWIATENGVSKFDGKNFKNYATAQGLPDNDVLSVQMDSSGVIWVMPFQRTPAYYDEKSDRFINSKTDTELKKINFGSLNNSNALASGGMGFCNNAGQIFIYKNKKCKGYSFKGVTGIMSTSRIIQLQDEKYLMVCSDSLRVIADGKIIQSYNLNKKIKRTSFVNNQLYIADSTELVKFSILKDGSIGKQVKVIFPFVIASLNFTVKQIAIASASGNIYLADTASLNISQQGFSFNSLTKYVYEDRVGNTWICTKENGLIRYQQKGILTISDDAFKRNFNALTFFNNKLVAGTNDGQAYFYNAPYDFKIISLGNEKNYTSWVRQIYAAKKDLYVSIEGGFYKINKNKNVVEVFNKKNSIANKDFIFVNDSIMFSGNSSFVSRINIETLKATDTLRIRVTALEASTPDNIYIGSNTGLYKWQNLKERKYFGATYSVLSNRVSSLAYNKEDEILWTGLATDSLVAMYKDAPIAVIPLGAQLPGNNCRALYSTKKGIVWVGTNLALGRIEYSLQNGKMSYAITVFTIADGIAGKQINDITEHNDTIYVATTSGISMIPALLRIGVPDIAVYVTSVKIDNADTTLLSEYNLAYNKKNISINFSAADLAATTERIYQYKINNGLWTETQLENIALQQLSPGKYKIQIRALKRDGNPSTKITEIIFNISAPFWKTVWFWTFLVLSLGGLVFYFTQRRNKVKREQGIQALLTEKKLSELELKALKAQINPHFVFNCLNSIKFLNHQKRFVETDKYLDKFSYLLRKTLDFSGLQKIPLEEELAYSKNYLELEKLRLGDKLNYEIITDENIDTTTTLVPPMLLQPYLENAIKHGIRHLQGEVGKVVIDTKRAGEIILCSISDNGVGIEKAASYNKLLNPEHTSQGTTLQQRRADLYNVAVQTIQGKNGIGTTVILTLQNEE